MAPTDAHQQLVYPQPPVAQFDAPETDERSLEEIRADIEAARQRIAANFAELQHEVEHTLERARDWRSWVREHPRQTLAISFAVGLYLGLR